ncbi:hypothetical protein AVEN_128644-1 [Araneus ventricosus]|uniref:Uncharacterized protein n=1 Tax=Araneus ventricosus TaxID=182803 RepID=A0A4Y2PSU7_ARAVE|nr:hypothetical protein AVEN_248600-1 [Araneus ventricosus]GBN54303.1 hypothetical protein AVEN_128644-1 [Araneus ventricosus]
MHQSAEEIQVGAARETALASVKVRSLRNCEATLRKTKPTFPPIESGGGLSCIGGSPLAQCQLPVAILFPSLRPQDGLRSLDLFLLRLFLVRRYLVMVSLSRCRRKLVCFNKHSFFTFSYTKCTKRKYCNRQKIRTRDFDGSPRFRPP